MLVKREAVACHHTCDPPAEHSGHPPHSLRDTVHFTLQYSRFEEHHFWHSGANSAKEEGYTTDCIEWVPDYNAHDVICGRICARAIANHKQVHVSIHYTAIVHKIHNLRIDLLWWS